jgi:hypothetical protein
MINDFGNISIFEHFLSKLSITKIRSGFMSDNDLPNTLPVATGVESKRQMSENIPL